MLIVLGMPNVMAEYYIYADFESYRCFRFEHYGIKITQTKQEQQN